MVAVVTMAIAFLAFPPGAAVALDLEEAMERAATNTEAAEILRLRIDAADGRRRAALGALLPTLDASVGITRNDRQVELGDRTFTSLWDTSAQIQARVDLFRGPAIPQWLAARTGVDVATETARWERARLRMMAADAWVTILTAVANVDVASDNLDLATESLAQTRARLETGFGLNADVALARTAVLDAEAELLAARRVLEDALDTLAFLVREDALALEQLAQTGPSLADAAGVDGPTADIAALELEEEAARRQVQAEHFNFLPTLSLAGTYHFGPSSVRAPDGRYWTVTLAATWRVFDFARYGRLQEARAERDIAGLRTEQAERERDRDLRAADRRIAETAARLELREEALLAAMESRELVASRFELGEATALELTQADSALFAARTRLNLAVLERARAELEAAWLRGALQDED
ncbi:MAG: TolC family protein [Deltaproteobacteria bacterium]|nr:MAG: TolC family protein [Deltaproteobacteria bacterium]